MTHIRNLIEFYLSNQDAEKFAEWAFGKDFATFSINTEAHIRWNERHRFILTLKGEGRPEDDIPKMIEMWRKLNETEQT